MRVTASLFVTLLVTAAAAFADATPAPEPTPGIPPLPAAIQWHTTASGLQYADTVLGKGEPPRDGQIAVVHFTGWLDDGTRFDSTRERNRPFGFPVGSGQVIKGWDEAVRTMKAGGKRRLIVPPALGYGESGLGGLVPPNAKLVFDIELIRIIDK